MDNTVKESEMCRRGNHPCSTFKICSVYDFELETNVIKSAGSPLVRLPQRSGCGLLGLWKNWTGVAGTCQLSGLPSPSVVFPCRQWGQAGRARLPSTLTGPQVKSQVFTWKTDSVGLCLQSVLIQIKHPCHTPQFQEVTPYSFNKSVFRGNFHTDLQTYLVQISLCSAAKVAKTQQRNSISMALPRGACA